jgi:DNA polymerase-4
MDRIIMHIDVNNAFLSWTAVDLLKQGFKYDIRNSYAVIGGDENKRHGIVLAKSTPCKKMGITTGESLYGARKKCPALKIYVPNYLLYQQMSTDLFTLLSNYSPDIEIFSIDECFMDYGKVKKLHGPVDEFALRIKEEIHKKLGFTVNIGIGNNKLCAKMASDFSKPNKLHTLYQNEIEEKLWPLPIEQLFGIGKKTSSKLKQLNIYTIGQLAKADPHELAKYFKNQANRMIQLANGIDHSLVNPEASAPKGISNSTTLAYDYTNKEEIYRVISAIAENVSISLRKQKKYANVVAIILKDKYFRSYSHQIKLKNATDITSEICETAKRLFDEAWDKEPIRLIGIRLDSLVEYTNHQVSLFESVDTREKDTNLDKVVDDLKEKFGYKVIKKAALTDNKIGKKYLK